MGTHTENSKHETSLEHAMEMADGNLKEAKRLRDKAREYFEAGDIDEDRLKSIERLYDIAAEDAQRTHHEV
ncbi:hypothetical protein [Zhihengliuella salsuginis]|uniref:Uncharacterized protein n=1 Tax=Zhihengliuella salsuginis TaxID=578222 RepID=A0ABQ3GLA8_9MICC|nr:hypothetical protein [Zhihengliuella salsuginis]GHD10040.1 hypothetical protein GCM10008096_23150 [Zhihengliuella salsuginis]